MKYLLLALLLAVPNALAASQFFRCELVEREHVSYKLRQSYGDITIEVGPPDQARIPGFSQTIPGPHNTQAMIFYYNVANATEDAFGRPGRTKLNLVLSELIPGTQMQKYYRSLSLSVDSGQVTKARLHRDFDSTFLRIECKRLVQQP